ncbi:NADH:ubiquinone reductase (Na(+)-transporting) subunit C [Bacteroidales bacterium OttesenSCG-928-M11]|nr:NADH:ubiquinone reductase (Na(+)-transporting) subunit C [Bacteroidales bacterium OttesenSCG-928-M11]
MNKDSNSYTLIYASVMVILVAFVLAFASEALRPQQAKNEEIDKMRQILAAINIPSTNNNAEELYSQYIVNTYNVNALGEKTEGDPFSTELENELRKPEEQRYYSVYEANIEGKTKYILSLRGAGLWGALWGFVSLNEDKDTVYGIVFGHEGETPGLGAEISQNSFAQQFVNKRIFNRSGEFVSIAIVKPGKTAQGQDYVDGISGGTITSNGVDVMIKSSLKAYESFLIKK